MTSLVLNTSNSTTFNSSIVTANNLPTMTSKDLLEVINQVRESLGEPTIRLNKFNEKIEDELEGDYYTKSVVQNLNGTESIIYQLSEEQCTLLSMRESKLVRRTVLNQLKLMKPRTPSTYKEALQFLIEAEEQKEQLALQVAQQQQVIEVQQVDVDALERIASRKGSMTMRDAAKLLNMRQKDLRDWMLANNWTYSPYADCYRPTSAHATAGHLTLSANEYDPLVRVTWKGLALLAKRLNKTLNTENN